MSNKFQNKYQSQTRSKPNVKLQNQTLRLGSHPRPNNSINYFKPKYLSHLSISMECLI